MPPLRALALAAALSCSPLLHAQRSAEIPVDQLLTEAAENTKKQDYAGAVEVYERVLARPGIPPQLAEAARYNLASALFRLPDYARAAEAFGRFLEAYPQSAQANDARMARAIAFALQEKWTEAAAAFREAEGVPSLRAQALGYRAECALRLSDNAQAIEAIEALVALGVRDAADADTVLTLVQLHLQQKQPERAVAPIVFLQGRPDLVDSAIRLNALVLETAGSLGEASKHAEAISLLRGALPREELLAQQRRRIVVMDDSLRRSESIPTTSPTALDLRSRLKKRLEAARSALAAVEKDEAYNGALWFRLGRAFYESDRPWEAVLLFEETLAKFPKAEVAEPALYALVRACFDINRRPRALELARRFQRDYPQSPLADQIAFLAGQVSFERQDFAGAVTLFGEAVERYPKSSLREQMIVLGANARFLEGDMTGARAQFRAYLKEYPNGQYTEDAAYRVAMSSFFSGDYAASVADLNDYLAANPNGLYVSDAEFRLAVCAFSAKDNEKTLTACDAWLLKHAGAVQTGDIHSLRGDALNALGRQDDAIAAFEQAAATAASDDVLGYALNEITKVLQARGEHGRIAEMYEAFVKRSPDSALVPSAFYWISRARAREGKVEEAARFIGENIGRFIGDPSKEGVEKMLGQLAQIVSRRPRAEPGKPRPPAPTLNELIDKLDAALAAAGPLEANTAKARLLLARAEMARLNRQPAEERRLIDSIADTFQPGDLGSTLLAVVGMRLVERSEFEHAEAHLRRLVSTYPKAEAADAGYVGLGEIALRRGDAQAALTLFKDAIDKAGGQTRAKEATLGQARALFALKRLDEAEKLFQQIAASREWRGESTAQSVFSLGEIARARGDLPAAQAHFQRVYVAYQKFLPWVSRAYLESGRTFEALGKREEAAATYREFLRQDKLGGFPEAALVREALAALDGSGGKQS